MKQTQQGFTLIELVMVIVIIGILSAVAVPKFVDLSVDARNATAQGVAGAISSGAAINYGARLANSSNGVPFKTATDCNATNLALLVPGSTFVDGTTLVAFTAAAAAADGKFEVMKTDTPGVCTAASVAAGTTVTCDIAARGGSAVAHATLICTKI